MPDAALLNLVLFLPLFGAALLIAAPAGDAAFTRRLALVVMAVQLALTVWLYARFDSSVGGLQFETRLPRARPARARPRRPAAVSRNGGVPRGPPAAAAAPRENAGPR